MSAPVEFRDVSFAIGERNILRNLSFTVEQGETLVLLGRSGSGKSTALKLVNAMLYPTSGEVRVEGRPTAQWEPIALRRRIGYAIQDVGLFPHFTVARNIGLVPHLENWPEDRVRTRVAELLRLLDLPPEQYASRYPRELSGGQQQRVGIARALAADPPILLFDEPFGALDPITRVEAQRQFGKLIREFNKTALFVTHDIREAISLATRIILLREGTIDVMTTPGMFRTAKTPEARAFVQSLD